MLIAHISDLHLNSFYNDSIFNKVNFVLKQVAESKADHLVVTGDITDNATEKDFEFFRRMLLKYGFLSGEKLSILFGNHDIFGGIQKAEDIFTFPERCSSTHYSECVNRFLRYFPEAFNNYHPLSADSMFPFVKKLGSTLIIGLNSITQYSKLSNPFGSNGEIDVSQFSKLYDILKTNDESIKYRVVLIHHHFNKLKSTAISTFGSIWSGIEKLTMKLRGKRRLFKLFDEFNIDIVLHGHVHESKEYYRKGIRFLNAGATIKSNKDFVNVNYLTITKENIEVNIDTIHFPEKLGNEPDLNKKKAHLKLFNAAMTA